MGCSSSQAKPGKWQKHRRKKDNDYVIDRRTTKTENEKVSFFFADESQFKGPPHLYKPEHADKQRENKQANKLDPQSGIRFKKAIYSGIYNVHLHSDDSQGCRIRGAEFLLNGDLIMCDQANHNLKLWSNTFQYLNHYNLPGRPHALCVYSSDSKGSDVFVTIPSDRTIMEFYIEGKVITSGEVIRTDGWCYGIAPYKNGLVVCVGTKLELMDTDGNVLKTLQYDKNGNTRFGSPFHVAVTPDNNILVSDSFKHYVVCMTEKGDEIFRYTEMSIPHNMYVDSGGYIFLCGSDDRVVDVLHQITNMGEKVKSLLSWRHVGFKPDTVCYRNWDQLLAVCGENDRIKTFRLVTRKTGRMFSNDAVMGVSDEIKEIKEDKMLRHRSTPEVQELMKEILKS